MAYNFSRTWVVVVLTMMVEWSPNANTEYVFTKDQLIHQYEAVEAYNRGICARTQNDVADLQGMTENSVHCCVRDIKAELKCNYVYNILVYLRLTVPENHGNRHLHYSVDQACPKWDQQLLKIMSDINFHDDKPYLFFAWLFYFHGQKMRLYANEYNQNSKQMQELHFGVSKYFEMAFLPTIRVNSRNNPVYWSYMEKLQQLDGNSALEHLTETCAHLNQLEGSEDFDLDRMHLNDVPVNNAIMNTLIAGFVHVEKGHQIADFLSTKMELVKNPATPFRDFVHSLKVVHFHFIRLLKTIMMRILWMVLSELNLPRMPKKQKALHFETFRRLLIDFAGYLNLKKNDEFNRLINGLCFQYLPLSMTLSSVVSLLKKNGEYESVGDTKNHRTTSLNLADIDMSRLAAISKEISQNIADTDEHTTPKSIVCGQVFFGFLKKILDGVSFRAIELFDEFDVFFVYHDFQQPEMAEMEGSSDGGEYSNEVINVIDEEEDDYQPTNNI